MKKKDFYRKITKAFFYLRTGYSFYFVFVISGLNALMIAYFVVGDPDKVEWIRYIFPHFIWFALFSIIIGVPMMIGVGYWHFTRQQYKSEMEVTWQNNPYYFKLIGHQRIMFELFIEIIKELKQTNQYSKEKTERHDKLIKEIKFLLDGGTLK
jgi:hypothetical protein